MNKKYNHIFFDLDHTLWDFDNNSANTIRTLYDDFKLSNKGISDVEELIYVYDAHNMKLWDRFRKGYIKREELRRKRFWLTLLDFKIGDTALAEELSKAYLQILPTQKVLMPFASELLEHCKPNYTLHLITNGYEKTQRIKLESSGIDGYFSEIFTSERCNGVKPQPEIFEYALNCTGADAENAIMIGDALDIDIAGAINAGWDQVYYNPQKIAHDKKPTYEVACFSELQSIL